MGTITGMGKPSQISHVDKKLIQTFVILLWGLFLQPKSQSYVQDTLERGKMWEWGKGMEIYQQTLNRATLTRRLGAETEVEI